MVIRRARRVSNFLGADCFAVAVQDSRGISSLPEHERVSIEKNLNFARQLHIETRILEGADTASVVIDFARRNGVTQIFVTRPDGSFRGLFSREDPVQRIVAQAKDMQIVIVSDREPVTRK